MLESLIFILLFVTLVGLIMFNNDFLILLVTLLLFFGSGLYMLSYYQKLKLFGLTLFPADFIAVILPIRIFKDTIVILLKNSVKKALILPFVCGAVYIGYIALNMLNQADLIGLKESFKIISYEWIYLSVLLTYAFYLNTRRQVNIIKKVAVYGALVLGILLLIDQYAIIFGFSGIRITTTHKGFLFLLPILIVLTSAREPKVIRYLIFFLSSIHLLMTTKRSLFIGIFGTAGFLLYHFRNNINLKKVLFGATIIIIVSTFILDEFYIYYAKYLYARFAEMRELYSGTGGRRLNEWKAAINIFAQAPFFGDTYNLYFNNGVSLLKEMHNTYLEKICMQGFIGFAIWVVLIFSGLRKKSCSRVRKEFENFNNVIIAMLLFSIPVMAFNTSWISIYPYGYIGIYFSLNNKRNFIEPKIRDNLNYESKSSHYNG